MPAGNALNFWEKLILNKMDVIVFEEQISRIKKEFPEIQLKNSIKRKAPEEDINLFINSIGMARCYPFINEPFGNILEDNIDELLSRILQAINKSKINTRICYNYLKSLNLIKN